MLMGFARHPILGYNVQFFVNGQNNNKLPYVYYFFSVIKWKDSALSKLTRYNCKLSFYCHTVMKPQYFHPLRHSTIEYFPSKICSYFGMDLQLMFH